MEHQSAQESVVSGQYHRMVMRMFRLCFKLMSASEDQVKAFMTSINGIAKYYGDFLEPFWIALDAFLTTEKKKATQLPLYETLADYMELLQFNLQIAEKGTASSLLMMNRYHFQQMERAMAAWINSAMGLNGEDIALYAARQAKLLEKVVHIYPKAIREIKSEYGFHFENPRYQMVAETDRFWLYQVFPMDSQVPVRQDGKPVLILPPYVLGPNILNFLPGERKSYVHAFANHGIPTYIRILKPIATTEAVQIMAAEDDVTDTRYFCEQLKARHGKHVTLNGFCQGGFIAMVGLLTGELDELVDALITCVAPMDGTRSKALVEYLQHLPPRFRDLGYAEKRLPNGNVVVDGKVMSWVYKLKSMDREAPLFAFYRDLMMFDRPDGQDVSITKTAAAINHWLIYDRTDLPVSITKLSFDSYTIPVTRDGTLPVSLFGRQLNFHRLKEKHIKTLICYAEKDDLVDAPAALAPLDFIDAEVTVFPKGHGAIATSWSVPTSQCALHTRFGKDNQYRGPVRFQLDLDQ